MFTKNEIKERKQQPYIIVTLYDKNINGLNNHTLFKIGTNDEVEKLAQNKYMTYGYVADQFRDCINEINDIKNIKIMINKRLFKKYDHY